VSFFQIPRAVLIFETNHISSIDLVRACVLPFQLKTDITFTMKFGIAALVLGSFLAPAAGAFSYLDSIAPKGGSSPSKNDYSVSKRNVNPVASPVAAGSSYLDGLADGLISSSIDNSDAMRIRSEYDAWLKRFGKTANESRYSTFKANFLALQEYGIQTGNIFPLNEFAEYSAEEFAQLNTASTSNAPTTFSGSANATPKTSDAPGAGRKPAAPVSLSSIPILAMGSGSPVPKKGYAPRQGSKSTAPAFSDVGSSSYLSLVAQPGASFTPLAAAGTSSYLQSFSNLAIESGSPVPKRGSFLPGLRTSTKKMKGNAAAPQSYFSRASYLSSGSNPAMGSGSPVSKKGYAPRQGSKPTGPAFSDVGSFSYLSLVAQPGASFAPLAAAGTSSYLQSVSNLAVGSGSPVDKRDYALPGLRTSTKKMRP
jgi:hypothetical protein